MKSKTKKDHYNWKNYDTFQRWCSYYTQITEILKLKPKKVLEIGIGNRTVSNYLKNQGVNVITCDTDANLNPDVVADVRNLPFKDNTFDVVYCCQVLEHIPFSDFETALSEIKRVSKKNVIISLPHFSFNFSLHIKLSKMKPMRLSFHIPLPIKHRFNGEHYWEIGKRGYPLKKIKKILKKYFIIERDFRVFNNPYHHFFILKRK